MEVPVRLLSDTARLPSRAHDDDAAFDLYADEALELAPGARARRWRPGSRSRSAAGHLGPRAAALGPRRPPRHHRAERPRPDRPRLPGRGDGDPAEHRSRRALRDRARRPHRPAADRARRARDAASRSRPSSRPPCGAPAVSARPGAERRGAPPRPPPPARLGAAARLPAPRPPRSRPPSRPSRARRARRTRVAQPEPCERGPEQRDRRADPEGEVEAVGERVRDPRAGVGARLRVGDRREHRKPERAAHQTRRVQQARADPALLRRQRLHRDDRRGHQREPHADRRQQRAGEHARRGRSRRGRCRPAARSRRWRAACRR